MKASQICWKYTATQVDEAQRSPDRFNTRRSSHRYIIIKLSKIKYKNRISKASKRKKTNHIQENPDKASILQI